MPNWCCGGSGLMMFVWLLFLAAVVVGAILLVRMLWNRTGASSDPPPTRPNAVGVLEERFARGEIDREEFERRRDALTS